MYTATCSQCKEELRAMTRPNLLEKLRKHLWSKHRNWMVKRIKAGRSGSKDNPVVLRLLRDLASGDFIPSYKAYKRENYERLKPTLDILAPLLPKEIQLAWKVVDKLAEKIYK